jgi:hypothetical protein
MTSAGYSGKPLCEKLGITPGTEVHVVNPPANYVEMLSPVPVEVSVIPGKPLERVMFLHLFVTREDELKHELVSLVDVLDKEGVFWMSWPKKSSGVMTDVTEETLRQYALPLGIVDTKVCAVDDTWSALKFVWRRVNREN